jgi:hypothetical protein
MIYYFSRLRIIPDQYALIFIIDYFALTHTQYEKN